MFTISKEFHFSASHVLGGLPEDHPCSRLHGHNYVVIVHLQAEDLDSVGMIQDYRDLEPIKKFIDEEWDHRHLNEKMCLDYHKNPIHPKEIEDKGTYPMNPTAENMAYYLFTMFEKRFPMIKGFSVKETPKTTAYYGK